MISAVEGAAAKHLHQGRNAAAVRGETGRLLVSSSGQCHCHCRNIC